MSIVQVIPNTTYIMILKKDERRQKEFSCRKCVLNEAMHYLSEINPF